MRPSLINALRKDHKTGVAFYGASLQQAGVTEQEAQEFHVRELEWDIPESSLEDVDAVVLMRQLIAHRDIYVMLLNHCRTRSADLYDQSGKKLNVICEEAKNREVCTRELLMAHIAGHECISFDIFDTLLVRKILRPEDVFELVGRKLRREGVVINGFKAERSRAQEELGLTNPTIEDIYGKICEKHNMSEEIKKLCVETEISIELSVLTPRLEMLEVYQECIKSGKKVSLVTDMYIPERFLELILRKNGIQDYSAIYVSCDKKRLKIQGLLEMYRKETGGVSYLHIGDHYIHDGICAALADMDYCLVAGVNQLVGRAGFSDCTERARSLMDHVMLGMIYARLFNSPFAMSGQEGKVYIHSDYDYGYAFCAPLISQFAVWLYRQIANSDFDDILFASRDGYLIKRLYGMICERLGGVSFPKGIYFYTSRKAAVMTNINNEAYVNMLIDMSRQMPPQELMRERFGLEEDNILIYDEDKYGDSIHKYVWDHSDAIFARAEMAKRNYFRYMGLLQLKIGAKYAFIDFVSSGTSQKSLARMVPFELFGFYVGWSGAEAKEDLGVRAPFEQGDSFFMRHYKIMETFMTSFEPSVSHFDGTGRPVFSSQDRDRKELRYVRSMQNACEDFLRGLLEIMEIMATEEKEMGNEFVDTVFSSCERAVVVDGDSVLNHMYLMDDWCKKRNRIM